MRQGAWCLGQRHLEPAFSGPRNFKNRLHRLVHKSADVDRRGFEFSVFDFADLAQIAQQTAQTNGLSIDAVALPLGRFVGQGCANALNGVLQFVVQTGQQTLAAASLLIAHLR